MGLQIVTQYKSQMFGALNGILGGGVYNPNVITDNDKYNIGVVRSSKPSFFTLYTPYIKLKINGSDSGTIFDVTKYGDGGRFVRNYYPDISTSYEAPVIDLNHSNYIHYKQSSDSSSSQLPTSGSSTTTLQNQPSLTSSQVPWVRNKRDVSSYSPY